MRRVGSKLSMMWEYVQPFFRERIYERENGRLRVWSHHHSPGTRAMGEKTRHAPSFVPT
jgi:hypothetical protein